MIEVGGAEGSRVAGEFAEAADVGTVVHLAFAISTVRQDVIESLLTTSSDASLAGLLGKATMVFLSAWSKAREKSNGAWSSPSANCLLCVLISSKLTVSLRKPRLSISMTSAR